MRVRPCFVCLVCLMCLVALSEASTITLYRFDTPVCIPDGIAETRTLNSTYTCTPFNISGQYASILCDKYHAQHILTVYTSPTCSSGQIYNLTVNDEVCTNGIIVYGCPAPMTCNTTIGEWSDWNATCGPAKRTRDVNCTFADGYNGTACTTCYADDRQDRQYHCFGDNETISVDYCNRATKTCHVSLNNSHPFNTPSGFWENTLFGDGWTLQIAPRTLSGAVAYYTVLPVAIPYSNIVITSGLSTDWAHLVVSSNPIGTIGPTGTCSLFKFTGNNITVKNIVTDTPLACYTSVPFGFDIWFHGSVLQFNGKGATVSNVVSTGAALLFFIESATDAGNVSITNVAISGQPSLPLMPPSGCWIGNVVALRGTLNVAVANTSCIVTVSTSGNNLVVSPSQSVVMSSSIFAIFRQAAISSTTNAEHSASSVNVIVYALVALAVAATFVWFIFYIFDKGTIKDFDGRIQRRLAGIRASRPIQALEQEMDAVGTDDAAPDDAMEPSEGHMSSEQSAPVRKRVPFATDETDA